MLVLWHGQDWMIWKTIGLNISFVSISCKRRSLMIQIWFQMRVEIKFFSIRIFYPVASVLDDFPTFDQWNKQLTKRFSLFKMISTATTTTTSINSTFPRKLLIDLRSLLDFFFEKWQTPFRQVFTRTNNFRLFRLFQLHVISCV